MKFHRTFLKSKRKEIALCKSVRPDIDGSCTNQLCVLSIEAARDCFIGIQSEDIFLAEEVGSCIMSFILTGETLNNNCAERHAMMPLHSIQNIVMLKEGNIFNQHFKICWMVKFYQQSLIVYDYFIKLSCCVR